MRKLSLFMHTSPDGFVAGPNGEMDWIKVDDEIFEFIAHKLEQCDPVVYGQTTDEIKEAYWPTAVHALKDEDLIDDYWLFINPILLSKVKLLFKGHQANSQLKLLKSTTLGNGVVCLHHERLPWS